MQKNLEINGTPKMLHDNLDNIQSSRPMTQV